MFMVKMLLIITADDSDHYDFWGYCNQGNRGIQAKLKYIFLHQS
jgi:hypothetical protein